MKITQDVRDYAASQGRIRFRGSPKRDEGKAAEFVSAGAEIYRRA